MSDNRTLLWERIRDSWNWGNPEGYTYRAKVRGGWLVSVWAGDKKDQRWGGGLTFMPDAKHEWDVAVPKAETLP